MVKGEVVYKYLYDVGGDIDLKKVERIYNRLPAELVLKTGKVVPKYIKLFPPPLTVSLSPVRGKVFGREVSIRKTIRVYSVGAVLTEFRVPFDCGLRDLISFASLELEINGRKTTLSEMSRESFGRVLVNLKGCIKKQYEMDEVPEEYTVYCVAERISIGKNKRAIAAILRGEKKVEKLTEEGIEDAMKLYSSYYKDDKVVVDWDSGFIIEPSGDYEDILIVIELANLQLLELRTYDGLLDVRSEHSYDILKKTLERGWGLFLTGELERLMFELARIRIEITEVVEETMNITKFIGDWYLAKLYSMMSNRLHIKDWHSSVMRKLDSVEEMYRMASDKSEMKRGNFLELVIVLLIVFEILLLFLGYW